MLLADLDDLDSQLMQGAASPGGTVRITASVGFGTLAIEPLLPAFWQLYPDIVVDLSLSTISSTSISTGPTSRFASASCLTRR